jgi:hypothetical protein
MKRRCHTLAETDIFSPLAAAVEVYCTRFGEALTAWQFCGRPTALARGLLIAVARGERMTDTDLYRMLDMTPLPGDLEHER